MRKLIFATLLAGMGTMVQAQTSWLNTKVSEMSFYTLPFEYESLEPIIDKATVEIHYSKHQRSYFDKFISAAKESEYYNKTLADIFEGINSVPAAIRNNAGGYFNHILYWEVLKPGNRSNTSKELLNAINLSFGSTDELKRQVTQEATNFFGSGWVWLCADRNGGLFVCSTPNQDNPLMANAQKQGTPILAMDVWEHAYYLKYQNRRSDYVNQIWNAINWEVVSELYQQANSRNK